MDAGGKAEGDPPSASLLLFRSSGSGKPCRNSNDPSFIGEKEGRLHHSSSKSHLHQENSLLCNTFPDAHAGGQIRNLSII